MAMQSTGMVFWPEKFIYRNAADAMGGAASLTVSGTYQAVVICAREAMTITHVGFMTGAVTGSPQATVSIETVDGATGLPSGSLFSASGNVATGVLTASGWFLFQLGAGAGVSITAGQMFAVKVTLNTASTTLTMATAGQTVGTGVPYRISATGAATKAASALCIALGSSSGAFYYVPGLHPQVTGTNTQWNNTNSVAKGLRFKLPFKARCIGLGFFKFTSIGDYTVGMYDDSGTELSSSITAYDGNQDAANTTGLNRCYFDSPVVLNPATWYRAAVAPSSATNVYLGLTTIPTTAYLTAAGYGTDAMYTVRTSGTWDDSATTTLPSMCLILDQFDDGVAVGGTGGTRCPIGS